MRTMILTAALLAALAPQALAGKPDKAKPNPNAPGMSAEDVVGIVFSEIERQLIGDYYKSKSGGGTGKGKSKQMPPGLAKRDELPPGLEQHIVKHGTLPPGLEKRDLPSDLILKLPAARKGTQRKIVGSDVVLIQTATGIILDVIRDVVKTQ